MKTRSGSELSLFLEGCCSRDDRQIRSRNDRRQTTDGGRQMVNTTAGTEKREECEGNVQRYTQGR